MDCYLGVHKRDVYPGSPLAASCRTRVIDIACCYVVIIWPCGIIIGKFTELWHNDKGGNEDAGLLNAGLWIGRLERFLILTFVLLDQYQAIGLLVAAKSIFRFTTDRKVSEYILIGLS
ncbi:MAG: hypothetical protein PWR29_1421 [Methanolobus sp.]|jgi:hypothetical protein|nr:hypothetical protein [Methanolobus sp.]MDK2912464.1 hypothetical protein [Methanolobus sp.]MDN5311016.1 hypothetical protein [Methanolobus sp.]